VRIAVLSDIHDNIWKLAAALERIRDADELLCCGDLCSPFVVNRLGEGFAGPIHVVFGNNDGDRFRITQQARRFGQITLYGETAELELGGKRIALHHYDDVGRLIAASGRFDVVCYGHNHRYDVVRDGQTLRINPGEIFGGLSGVSTYVVYDTETDAATRFEV
jgi:putative phosphoesterase